MKCCLFPYFYDFTDIGSAHQTRNCAGLTPAATHNSWVNTTWIAEIYGIIRLLDRTIYKLFNFVSISPRTNSLPFNFCARSGKTTSITFYSFILFEIAWQVSIKTYTANWMQLVLQFILMMDRCKYDTYKTSNDLWLYYNQTLSDIQFFR